VTGNVTQAEAEAEAEISPVVPTCGKSKKRRPAETGFPVGWSPTESHAARCSSSGLDIQDEAERFEAHHRARGSTFACWNSAFTTWLMNAVKFRKERGGKPERTLGIEPRQEDIPW
jgi:hypothetical protein